MIIPDLRQIIVNIHLWYNPLRNISYIIAPFDRLRERLYSYQTTQFTKQGIQILSTVAATLRNVFNTVNPTPLASGDAR